MMADAIARQLVELLLYSLPLGLLLALSTFLLLRVLPKFEAQTRYLAWGATLIMMIALLALSSIPSTASWNSGRLPDRSVQSTPLVADVQSFAKLRTAGAAQSAENRHRVIPDFLAWTPPPELVRLVAALWVTGAIASLLQLARGYRYLRALKRNSSPLDLTDRKVLTTFLQSRSTRQIQVRSSSDVPAPLAAGLRNPTVLIPDSVLNTLGEKEIEDIVLHEVAHLIRYDDWTKFLQKLIQAVFFFHPAVAWISRNLDLERELACDAWVIEEARRKPRELARSLLRLAEHLFTMQPSAQRIAERGAPMAKTAIEMRVQVLASERRTFKPSLKRAGWAGTFLGLVMTGLLALQTLPGIALSNQEGSIAALTDLASVGEFQQIFNADVDSPRLLLLLSPTCPVCIAGARFVQNQILAKNPDANLTVYTIWFEMLPSDSRDEWDPDLLADPRVRHYWDDGQLLGRHYAANAKIRGTGGPIAWDVYAIYGPGASWEGVLPEPLVSAGAPVVNFRGEIRRGLEEYLQMR